MSDDKVQLPAGWVRASISDVCDYNPKHDRDTPDDLTVSFVPMAAVSDLTGRIETPETRRFGEVRKGFTHFSEGDVIWAKITPCMENGKSAVAEKLINSMACGSTEFMVFRPLGGMNAAYLHRYLRQEGYRKAARKTMKSGVGQARVPKEFVLETQLPLPPLQEQRRIVSRIETLQQHTDTAQASLNAIPILLEKFRQSVLAAAFRGDLTKAWRAAHPDVEPASELLQRIRAERRDRWIEAEAEKNRAKAETQAQQAGKLWTAEDDAKVLEKERAKVAKKYKELEPVKLEGLPTLPTGWCWTTLSEIADIKGGLAKGKKYPVGTTLQEIAYLRVANVQRGYLDLKEVKRICAAHHEIEELRLQSGDVLFNEGGDRDKLGRGCVWNDELENCIHQNHVFRARLSNLVLPAFVSHYGNSPVAKIYFLQNGKQSTNLASININKLKLLPVPLPPQQEQAAIVDAIANFLEVVDLLAIKVSTFSDLLKFLSQSILAKAFRGELVPQDPNDEPASVLLERIRAERAATGTTVRRRGRKQTVVN